jgi:hypothetical protein
VCFREIHVHFSLISRLYECRCLKEDPSPWRSQSIFGHLVVFSVRFFSRLQRTCSAALAKAPRVGIHTLHSVDELRIARLMWRPHPSVHQRVCHQVSGDQTVRRILLKFGSRVPYENFRAAMRFVNFSTATRFIQGPKRVPTRSVRQIVCPWYRSGI